MSAAHYSRNCSDPVPEEGGHPGPTVAACWSWVTQSESDRTLRTPGRVIADVSGQLSAASEAPPRSVRAAHGSKGPARRSLHNQAPLFVFAPLALGG